MIAQRQRGLVARRQLLAAGISRSAIGRLIAGGRLHRIHQNVHAVGHVAPAPLVPETAALLACGEGAALSHVSAALLWKMIKEGGGDHRIHVTIPHRHGPSLEGVCVHRSATLTPGDIRVKQQLPVTSPVRTLLDLADVLPRRELEEALDEALVERLVSKQTVAEAARRAHGRRGAARLAAALDRHTVTQDTRSRAEKRLRDLVRAAELPEPQMNVYVQGCLVDAYWPAQRLVVEFDSAKYHANLPVFEHDRAKGNKLVAAGIAVMRLTWRQLRDQPLVVVARIAQALARAEASWAA